MPFDANSENVPTKRFVDAYMRGYGHTPDQFAADGYDAIYAIYRAMEAANIDDASIDVSDLCEAVVEAITANDFKMDGATGSMSWLTTGACYKVPQIVVVQ